MPPSLLYLGMDGCGVEAVPNSEWLLGNSHATRGDRCDRTTWAALQTWTNWLLFYIVQMGRAMELGFDAKDQPEELCAAKPVRMATRRAGPSLDAEYSWCVSASHPSIPRHDLTDRCGPIHSAP